MTTKALNLPTFPRLPLICLDDSAEELTTHDVVKGKNTVIDFWTTRCTRCPAALDQLNANTKLEHVQRVSICCDKLDGARQILDQHEERRWNNMQHYFMNHDDKERAKKILGFTAVPFYVVLNEQGDIVQLGNKIDWDSIPGGASGNDKENEDYVQVPDQEDQVFVVDDLDF